MKKLNILILSWRGPNHPNAGGAEQSTFEHAKGWVKAGHKVSLFTSYYVGAKREENLEGISIVRKGAQFLGVQAEAFKWYLFGSHKKFDLVVDEFHGIPFFTPLYVRTKKLAFIHEVTKEVWRLNPWPLPFNIAASIIGSRIEPLIFKYLYFNILFMTVSESTKQDLTLWGILEKNITIIHNGINIFKSKTIPNKERKKTLIFLGNLSKDKGIEDAIKVFYLINKKQKDWQFWIVGGKASAKYLESLKNLTNKLNLNKNIKFFGYVGEKRKYELLGKAHILINPSIREGWGLVVIEAAYLGTPTVGYNVAGLRDSIRNGETGILCEKNPTSCMQAVLSLMSDQKKYQLLVQNCFRWAKQFSWDKSVKKSLTLIEKLARS